MALLETAAVYLALSTATVAELGRVESLMAASPTARRLLAETVDVPRREARGPAIRYVPEKDLIAFDSRRLREMTEYETQLVLARELARAALRLPLRVVEAEMAAYQEELAVAVELDDPRLRRSVQVMERSVEALRKGRQWERERLGLDIDRQPPLTLPANEVDRIAYLLVLFRIEPDEMYWAIERGRQWPEHAARAVELEDFLTLHSGAALPDVPPEAPYVRVKGRRYRPGLVAAAKKLQELGGLARLREALGSFETRPIPELRSKVNDWSRR